MERLTPAQVRGLKIRCKLMQSILEFPGSTLDELIENSGVNLSKRQVERHLLTLISDELAKVKDGKIYMAETPLKIFQSQIACICRQGIEKFKFNSAHYRKNH